MRSDGHVTHQAPSSPPQPRTVLDKRTCHKELADRASASTTARPLRDASSSIDAGPSSLDDSTLVAEVDPRDRSLNWIAPFPTLDPTQP